MHKSLADLPIDPRQRFEISQAINYVHLVCSAATNEEVAKALVMTLMNPIKDMQRRFTNPNPRRIRVACAVIEHPVEVRPE